MVRLSDTAANTVPDEQVSTPVTPASELVHVPIMITAKRFAMTSFGKNACFADYSRVDDPDAEVHTVVFSSFSPAYKKLEKITDEDLKEGLFVMISPVGKTFTLIDPDDAPADADIPF